MWHNSIRADDDQRLAVSVKQGNRQSFGLLYDKYAPALSGIISRIANNEKLAEVILNKTFVKLWNQMVTFNSSKTSVFTWLINIARQTAFDEVKSEQKKNPPYDNPVYEENKNGFKNSSPINGQNLTSSFDLVYYKGLNFNEAATELDITVAELKTDIRIIINKLKEKEVLC